MSEPTDEQIQRMVPFAVELVKMAGYDGPFDAWHWSKCALAHALKGSE